MIKTSALYRYEREAVRKRAAGIAKQLGVTPHGLEQLARAIATDKRIGGTGAQALFARGLVDETPRARGYIDWVINDAGREIVRQARELGW